MTNTPHKTLFRIHSDPRNVVPFLKSKVAPLLAQAGFQSPVQDSIVIALGEAVTNCIRHSYGGKTSEVIDLTLEDRESEMIFHVRDYGTPVDLKKIQAKLSPQLPPEKPGGLGVYFIKSFMDSMEYNTTLARGTELILKKKKAE